MANLSITTACNKQCRYCFARSALKKHRVKAEHMSLEIFQQALNFLERSEIEQVRLLGGEPTLHPQFPHLVEHVIERGLRLLVFSNGLMPEDAICCLEKTSPEQTTVLVNVQHPDASDVEEQERQFEVFRRLGTRVIPGLNIDTPAIQLDFLVELIEQHQLARTVRLGLAHPVLSETNHFLAPRYYETVARKIVELGLLAKYEGIYLEFDCGFVPCMFSPEDLDILGNTAEEFGTRCNPVLDILPDGQVVSCYPLADLHHEQLPAKYDASWLREQFETRIAPYRTLGIFRECSSCPLRKHGACVGGCLALAMRRLHSSPFTFALTQGESEEHIPTLPVYEDDIAEVFDTPDAADARWIIPYIDQPLDFWEQVAESYSRQIKEVYLPLPGDIMGSGRPIQPEQHVKEFLDASLFPVSVLINPIISRLPIEDIAPQIVASLEALMNMGNITGATISDFRLAKRMKETLPDLALTASVLMDLAQPNQAVMLEDAFDSLVPASRIMRNAFALKTLKQAFQGYIRLMVNEACLPGCPFRVQHFYEMGSNMRQDPQSLCDELLQHHPWMRLTGAWVLPQHLHLYEGLYDELKLAGRVTLRDPERYLKVLDAYLHRTPLLPHEIGGGPASVLEPIEITEAFFARTFYCEHQCHQCTFCRDYYQKALDDLNR